ncbi:MAG: hypothetical protein ABL958_07185 [Bdellovibrionia bacterium]
MKKSAIFALVVFAISLSAFAAPSTKVCFFAGGDLGEKGDRILATIASTKIKVQNLKGESAWEGVHTRKAKDLIKGKDGKTYLDFYYGGDEGCNTILVDANLLRNTTTGLIKFRCRGEGFGETVFFCRDNQ